jgi:hypothetical protein
LITPYSNLMWTKRFLATSGALLTLLCTSVEARAQGCCAFGSSLTPTRLDLHEQVLVGFQLGTSWLHGSHAPNGDYRSSPNGTTDVELRQTLFATAALGSRAQVSVLVPWVETFRAARSSSSEWGQGPGDVSALARVDIVQLHEYSSVPAVAVILGGLFPTGTAAEQSTLTLGSDTTGGGIYRAVVGVGVEQNFGSWLLSVTGSASFAPPSKRSGIATQHAARWSFIAAASYAWSHHLSTAGVVSFETEGDTRIDGRSTPGSHKRRSELAAVSTYSFDDAWRAQFRLSAEPPLSQLGINEPARLSGNVALIWSAL